MKKNNDNLLSKVILNVQEIESKLEKISFNLKDYWQMESEIKKLREDILKVYRTIAIEKLK